MYLAAPGSGEQGKGGVDFDSRLIVLVLGNGERCQVRVASGTCKAAKALGGRGRDAESMREQGRGVRKK